MGMYAIGCRVLAVTAAAEDLHRRRARDLDLHDRFGVPSIRDRQLDVVVAVRIVGIGDGYNLHFVLLKESPNFNPMGAGLLLVYVPVVDVVFQIPNLIPEA